MSQPLPETTFRLRDTECNSRVFGPCEVCGKDAVQVFSQTRTIQQYYPQIGRVVSIDKPNIYGHYACLVAIRERFAALCSTARQQGIKEQA